MMNSIAYNEYAFCRCSLLSVIVSVTLLLTACSHNLKPDNYPSGTKVTLRMEDILTEPFQLGPRSSQLVLDMLTNQPIHSNISQATALPMGTFTVGDTQYLWHGNAVIRGKGRNERLWHGPYLQRLIADVVREHPRDHLSLQRILDKLESDSTVATTALAGPGAYPGAGDGWRVFTPETNKP